MEGILMHTIAKIYGYSILFTLTCTILALLPARVLYRAAGGTRQFPYHYISKWVEGNIPDPPGPDD